MTAYDVIGDVHGYADKLVGLLHKLGYRDLDGAWRHPERTAVFVGDLVDRGPRQRASIEIPRAMVEAESAQIVLGNHEFNAIAYATWDDERGDYCRPHSEKNVEQHRAFLDQIGEDSAAHRDAIAWFRTIPLWLDLDGLRVVHACWSDTMIDHLRPLVNATGGVTDQLVIDGTTTGHPTYDAIETIVKGPEIGLGGRCYRDKGGHERRDARQRWWDPDATTLRQVALIPNGTKDCGGGRFDPLPNEPVDDQLDLSYRGEAPVIVGHYWETGRPSSLGPKVACVDYSAGRGGPLVAYRWDGESILDDGHFVAF